jgi:hypothetical protein
MASVRRTHGVHPAFAVAHPQEWAAEAITADRLSTVVGAHRTYSGGSRPHPSRQQRIFRCPSAL